MAHASLYTTKAPARPCQPSIPQAVALAVFGALLATADARGEGLSISNARDLLAAQPATVKRFLEVARPPAVSPAVRARILESLPPQGEILALNRSGREKLAALAPVLRAVQREQVYVIKVIDVPQAVIGIHGRTVLLISGTALALLDANELAAAAAHEAAHEYLWDEWERAVQLGDKTRLRDIELICDANRRVHPRCRGVGVPPPC